MVFPSSSGSLKSQNPNGRNDLLEASAQSHAEYLQPASWVCLGSDQAGKMSVRGGFGIFYDKPSEQLYNDYFTNSPKFALGSACAAVRNQSAAVCSGHYFGSAVQLSPPPGIQPGLLPSGGLISGQANVTVTDRNMGPSYMENWFFGVQRAVTSYDRCGS